MREAVRNRARERGRDLEEERSGRRPAIMKKATSTPRDRRDWEGKRDRQIYRLSSYSFEERRLVKIIASGAGKKEREIEREGNKNERRREKEREREK